MRLAPPVILVIGQKDHTRPRLGSAGGADHVSTGLGANGVADWTLAVAEHLGGKFAEHEIEATTALPPSRAVPTRTRDRPEHTCHLNLLSLRPSCSRCVPRDAPRAYRRRPAIGRGSFCSAPRRKLSPRSYIIRVGALSLIGFIQIRHGDGYRTPPPAVPVAGTFRNSGYFGSKCDHSACFASVRAILPFTTKPMAYSVATRVTMKANRLGRLGRWSVSAL